MEVGAAALLARSTLGRVDGWKACFERKKKHEHGATGREIGRLCDMCRLRDEDPGADGGVGAALATTFRSEAMTSLGEHIPVQGYDPKAKSGS